MIPLNRKGIKRESRVI